MSENILKGYTSMERPYKVDNYPYGGMRTSIHYWIESKPKLGDRMGSYTLNPKNGWKNKPKYSSYSPFKYLYIDEKGHVQIGQIDSYEIEQFKARFEFLLNRIGVEYINDTQKINLRVNHYQHVLGNAPYEFVKYSDAKKEEFRKWLDVTLNHIKTCEFKKLVNYAEKPEYDNPDGEVKVTIKQY